MIYVLNFSPENLIRQKVFQWRQIESRDNDHQWP